MKNDQINAITAHESAQAGVAQRLRALRMGKSLTQIQLAELAGTNQAVIQKIENGHSLRPRCLASLAVVFDVNPAWLAWGEPYALSDTSEWTLIER